MRAPNYKVIHEDDEFVLLRDVGPWDRYPTITNGAEAVVAEIAARVGARKLLYVDSSGEWTELRISNGRFVGFAPSDAIALPAEARDLAVRR